VAESWHPGPHRYLTLVPQGPTIGAEIKGLDLRSVDAGPVAEELQRALLEWKVLMLRDQELSATEQEQLAGLWGAPAVQLMAPGASASLREGDKITAASNYWHCDDSYWPVPPKMTILQAKQLPPEGGDTVFSDMATAYDNLSGAVKELVAGRYAIHDWLPYSVFVYDQIERIRAEHPPVAHPIVLSHPETNRSTLFVNSAWVQNVVDLDPLESSHLLLHLSSQALVPEYQYRVHWEPGTVVMWDNYAVQHYACSDYGDHPRTMMRTSVHGAVPLLAAENL